MSASTYRYYIAGPMSDRPNFNIAAFDAAEAFLRKTNANIEVVNPANFAREWIDKNRTRKPKESDYVQLFERRVDALKTCNCIYLLRGWERSNSAVSELYCAIEWALEIEVEQ